MERITRVAILASGNGSNAENIIRICRQELSSVQVVLVMTENPDAGVTERCHRLDCPLSIIPSPRLEEMRDATLRRLHHENMMIKVLKQYMVDWVCLAGYMRILGPNILGAFHNELTGQSNIVNIHPSLLPAFPGRNSYKQAYEYGVKISGVTLHYVDEGVDTGPIIYQASFDRLLGDTLEQFIAKGFKQEYALYRRFLWDLEIDGRPG